MLASSIIRFIQNDGRAIVLYHFCSYLSRPSTEFSYVMRNFVAQLLFHNQDLIGYVYEEYILKHEEARPSILAQLFLFLTQYLPTGPGKTVDVRIVLDGVDECSEIEQQRILDVLDRFVECRQSGLVCKALVSSRDILKLRRLKKKESLSLNEEKHNLSLSVRIYVKQRMESARFSLCEYEISENDFQYAEDAIVEKSDGMEKQ